MISLISNSKPLFIAEISSNHNGDLNRCKELIDATHEAGCDGVKFQLFKIRELFSKEAIQKKPELLKRIEKYLDPDIVKLITIGTFHSIALNQLTSNNFKINDTMPESMPEEYLINYIAVLVIFCQAVPFQKQG